MKKLLAVLKREYLSAVRKKMFIIMTFLLPVLMSGLMVLPGMMMMRGLGEKRVAVLDATGELKDAFTPRVKATVQGLPAPGRRGDLPNLLNVEYVDRRGDQKLDDSAKPYLSRLSSEDKSTKLDAVFLIPPDSLKNSDAHLKYYSRSATDFISQERLSSMTNRAVRRYRLAARGLAPEEIDRLTKDINVDSVQISKTGEQKKGGTANFLVGFILTALLIIPSFIYGLEIMRGIIQEKTDRVVEILISSMSPTQLLVGKILGVALVGLTQITVWILMAVAVGAFGIGTLALAGENVLQLIRPMTFVYFAIFFSLAYLTYVCVYAIGGAICNSEKEAQQLIAPITMVMMLPWFLLVGIITNPDSNLAVGFSMAPVFGPMTMYVRTLVADPPLWHIVVSVLVSMATIAAFFWITAKIFRVGILSYGKRPTIPELWRWLKVA
jgi:ABC-2 type transport system permease protein